MKSFYFCCRDDGQHLSDLLRIVPDDLARVSINMSRIRLFHEILTILVIK